MAPHRRSVRHSARRVLAARVNIDPPAWSAGRALRMDTSGSARAHHVRRDRRRVRCRRSRPSHGPASRLTRRCSGPAVFTGLHCSPGSSPSSVWPAAEHFFVRPSPGPWVGSTLGHDACSTGRLACTRNEDTVPAPREPVGLRNGGPGWSDARGFCLSTKHASPSSPEVAERAPCLRRSATDGRSHRNAGGVGFKHPRRGRAPPTSPKPRPTAQGQTADQAPAWVAGAAHTGLRSLTVGTAWLLAPGSYSGGMTPSKLGGGVGSCLSTENVMEIVWSGPQRTRVGLFAEGRAFPSLAGGDGVAGAGDRGGGGGDGCRRIQPVAPAGLAGGVAAGGRYGPTARSTALTTSVGV